MEDQIQIDPLSQTSYFIECMIDENTLASGTCFFIIRNHETYLITNWHNVTGRNPLNNSYLGPHAIGPNKIRVRIFTSADIIDWITLDIPLYSPEGKILWLEHPTFKEKVDIVAIKVEIPSNMQVFDVEKFIEPYNEHTRIGVRDDVFILGYPFGIDGGGGLPIWKRASVASEPDIDLDDLPKIFVDTASRSGMSGSPVIYKEKRSAGIGDGHPGEARNFSWHLMKFVGIYSGRIGADDELKAQLGIVWKSNVIDSIISQ